MPAQACCELFLDENIVPKYPSFENDLLAGINLFYGRAEEVKHSVLHV